MPIHDHQPAFRGRAFFWGGIGLGVLLIAVMLTHGFGLWGGSSKAPAEAVWVIKQGDKLLIPEGSPLRARIAVAAATIDPLTAALTLPGLVETDPARTATVIPQLSGRVLDLKVRLGDRVTKGQVLAILDSADLAQAYSDYDKADDAAKLAVKNLDRQQEQANIGVASDRDLDQSRSDHRQAEAEYARTRARLAVLGAPLASRGPSRRLLVRAPVGGSITTLSTTPDSTINDPTQPIMTIADLSTVWVTALVPEKDIGGLMQGNAAAITLLAYPDRPLSGKILFVGDVIEPDSRREKIRIAVANADYTIKPNMFATVTLTGPPRSQVLLPSSALLMNNDRTSVFVATAPWVFERRTVDPQLQDGPMVAIRSGVVAGDQVVVKGGILLND